MRTTVDRSGPERVGELLPGPDRLIRSKTLPGVSLAPVAALGDNRTRIRLVVKLGFAISVLAAFASLLASLRMDLLS